MKKLKRILIANRGEIAHRIAKTAIRMGLEPIIVYSDADRETLTVKEATEAHYLGASPVSESYLNQDKVLEMAKRTGADAIHPGYGFLSENSEFARKVLGSGLIWIGPTPESMEKVASKSRAKEVAIAAKVPTLPGHQGDQKIESFLKVADQMGYPVLLKATAGGGGRGIRKVSSSEELKVQIEIARAEALSSFGDDEILMEKYVESAHHIEVQVFGDVHGKIIHMGERDCSVQRRNQKVIEESPSAAITPKLREEITSAAVRLAQTAGYTNAGTVEFLVTPQGEFYFLEMNTRLQVEHTVTEYVTGLDLVEWQFRIAMGEPLPLKQEQIKFSGHSIQVRLYAEDPYNGYRPQTGRIQKFHFPKDVRVDHFLSDRTDITPYYDSMLAKIIVHAHDRKEAIHKLLKALDETMISGLITNREFLKDICIRDFFQTAKTYTRTLDYLGFIKSNPTSDDRNFAFIMSAAIFYFQSRSKLNDDLAAWTNSLGRNALFFLDSDQVTHTLKVAEHQDAIVIETYNQSFTLQNFKLSENKASFDYENKHLEALFLGQDDDLLISVHGHHHRITNCVHQRHKAENLKNPLFLTAPMDGNLIKVLVKVNDSVEAGQVLAIMEAMKMQSELKAQTSGQVEEILLPEKSMVKNGQTIIKLKN